MIRILCTLLSFLLFNGFSLLSAPLVFSEEESTDYPIIFGWKTSGSGTLLAKKSTAIKLMKKNGIALSFGSLFGQTRIVKYNDGLEFLTAANTAGIDFVIPAADEFMFGVETFRKLAMRTDTPEFISANLVDAKTQKPFVAPYAVLDLPGKRVCVIALSDTEIIKQAEDRNIIGLDIIPNDEALASIIPAVESEYADLVVVAGRMNRASVLQLAESFDIIDVFITNFQAGGFSDSLGTTSNVYVSGKPVYIGPEAGDRLGIFTLKLHEGMESYEFRDIALGDAFPQDEDISSQLSVILDELKILDMEKAIIEKTGSETAGILKKIYGVQAVFLDRRSLYYFPLKDSLSVYDVRRVVRPEQRITRFTIKGSLLKSVWEQHLAQTDPDMRLLSGGVTIDGKVISIPIQDDINYTVLTTTYLRAGGDGYEQFWAGFDEKPIENDMLTVIEDYLVEKEELLRKLAKQKIWELSLSLNLNTNYNRKDVDVDKAKYGNDIPKSWRGYEDFYKGDFIINSNKNKLAVDQTFGKHIYHTELEVSWGRTGSKTQTKKGIIYDEPRNSDPVRLYNKYTYDLPNFPIKPYVDTTVASFLYSGAGKHPLTGITSAGATRTFNSLWGLNVNIGVSGTRDYTTLKNTVGLSSKIEIGKKEFPAGKIFKTPITIETRTVINWNPLHDYLMAFQHENINKITISIVKKIALEINVSTFSYRSTKQRKVALGFYYQLLLSYNMNWKF